LLADAAPREVDVVSSLAFELRDSGHPSLAFALAGVSWASGMPAGSAGAIAIASQAAGWIAHALEEHRTPTPYRPRLAYTGPAPRPGTPRRTLDAVRSYLSRQ